MTKLEGVIYPFVHPELKGKDWRLNYITGGLVLVAVRTSTSKAVCVPSQPLYINGKYNANFFMHEIEPRLRAQRVAVRFGFAGDNWWYVDPLDDDKNAYFNPDPMKAVGEYLGGKE